MTELDENVTTGATVELEGTTGFWRVSTWEWRDTGVELGLERIAPRVSAEPTPVEADPGSFVPATDAAMPATIIAAFELPWDGTTGNGDQPAAFASLSASSSNWGGAALFADQGDGQLQPVGTSGRARSIMGTTLDPLEPASSLLCDRNAQIRLELQSADFELVSASMNQLAEGANLALVGSEIIQFAQATPLGDRLWLIKGMLRGRGGTEFATDGHIAGEQFVLLDGRPVAVEASALGDNPARRVAAVGRGDAEPVTTPVLLQGLTRRPLSPVHPRGTYLTDGTLRLTWVRRARGGWLWRDGVDVPLVEEAEKYLVTYGPPEAPVASWQLSTPALELTAQLVSELQAALPGGSFHVRQLGTHALSLPLHLADLP